jgi:hypothetical protein
LGDLAPADDGDGGKWKENGHRYDARELDSERLARAWRADPGMGT